MNVECPNCRQLTNSSFSRLVKDSCGHTKCRVCLLYEEDGCKTCNNEHRIQNIGNYDCALSQKETQSNLCVDGESNITSEEIILPLELVINKDSKSKANHFELSSFDRVNDSQPYADDNIFNNEVQIYKSSTIDTNIDNISNKLYIPKIEPCNMILNIHAHLNDAANSLDEAQTIYNKSATDINNLTVKPSFSVKEKSLKFKSQKYPDRAHISIIPGTPEKYKCNICGKIFRNKKGKCYHDACITGIRPYQCSFCDRSFVKRSHFEYHERVHSGYKPFKCNLCEKAFPQQNKLNRHMYSHSKEKQFVCTKCNKRYTKQDDLKNHLSLHNGTATYSCKVCEKTFRILTNLKRHMRTHTNERPHVCEQCNKSFKDKSLLLRHQRTHGKERPFSCAHCNRVFLSKSELRRHLAVHSDEKPFSCEYCQTVFRRKDNLNRHIRHHHSEDSSFEIDILQNAVPNTVTKLVKPKRLNPKQKPKKTKRIASNSLSKSPTKVSVVYVSSCDQINSRLDLMGNITPVIRTTSEVSNAVPVINGPISIRKPEDKTDTRKKTFIYTEPIPLEEAVVINRRIEEKLYPQNVSNHNYFSHNCQNCSDKSFPALISQTSNDSSGTNSSRVCTMFYENSTPETSSMQTNFTCRNMESAECTNGPVIGNKVCIKPATEDGDKNDDKCLSRPNKSVPRTMSVSECNNVHSSPDNRMFAPVIREQVRFAPTIKKHIIQQFQSETSTNLVSANNSSETVDNVSLPNKTADLSEKKQGNVHWRRRMADILKPSNQ